MEGWKGMSTGIEVMRTGEGCREMKGNDYRDEGNEYKERVEGWKGMSRGMEGNEYRDGRE